MCGIIGVISTHKKDVSNMLLDGLKRLEYRGYDSAGIATLSSDGILQCRRSQGKLNALENEIRQNPANGSTGIGHTRWATHGRPTTNNAHPHSTERVAVVHNGIIENFRELRKRLESKGHTLSSDTDTEVIPHLITRYLEWGMSPEEAVARTVKLLSGSFALAILFSGKSNFLIAVKRGSPLAIGYGESHMFIGSDAIALAPFTSRIAYLEDDDLACIKNTEVIIKDSRNNRVNRPVRNSSAANDTFGKGEYTHYMLKEIHEQPQIFSSVTAQYTHAETKEACLPKLPFNLAEIPALNITACGTSYYAGMVAKYWLEKYAKLPAVIDIASELRYRHTQFYNAGVSLFISQSGETADTLAALKFAQDKNQYVISLVNVAESAMALASDVVLTTNAGAEIGVASTKAFTAQLAALAYLTLAIAHEKNSISIQDYNKAMAAIMGLPALAAEILGYEKTLSLLADKLQDARNILFIGRGTSYPVALEGALKFKELTYIHAEGVAAGELKHGPLALIDENMPVIAIAPSDALFEKTYSNIQEIAARGGKVIALCDTKGAAALGDIVSAAIVMPECHEILAPILYTIPLQMLAYYTACAKGNDVDQPRNLAKSVTVE